MALKYIITGTGRCGTMFMSKLLSSANIPCGHEIIFTNDGIEQAKSNLDLHRDLQADASYMAAPFLNHDILKDARIIHLVRNPIDVINSFVIGYCYFLSGRPTSEQIDGEWTYEYPPGADPDFKFMKFIYHYAPELRDSTLTPVDRAALYYILWNTMIEKHCQGRDFLLHPIEKDVSQVSRYIDAGNVDLYNNKKTNKAEYKKIYKISNISSKIIKKELITIGNRYGYLIPTIL